MTRYLAADVVSGIYNHEKVEGALGYKDFLAALPTVAPGEIIFAEVSEEEAGKLDDEYGIN